MYFEIIDYLHLGVGVLPEKTNQLNEMYGPLHDIPTLKSQFSFIYRNEDLHKGTCNELQTHVFKTSPQSSNPEAVKLMKMNGVLTQLALRLKSHFPA